MNVTCLYRGLSAYVGDQHIHGDIFTIHIFVNRISNYWVHHVPIDEKIMLLNKRKENIKKRIWSSLRKKITSLRLMLFSCKTRISINSEVCVRNVKIHTTV